MTFEEWRAQGYYTPSLTDDEAGSYEGESGFSYPGGFIILNAEGFMVPLPQTQDHTFTTRDAAERFLWAEWCEGELN